MYKLPPQSVRIRFLWLMLGSALLLLSWACEKQTESLGMDAELIMGLKASADDLVNIYAALEHVPLSPLYDMTREIIAARVACYGQHYTIEGRTLCRKTYAQQIYFVAAENIRSTPMKGYFVLCVRLCPLAYAICQGDQTLQAGDDATDCIAKEAQCIESCMDDFWRGGSFTAYRSTGR